MTFPNQQYSDEKQNKLSVFEKLLSQIQKLKEKIELQEKKEREAEEISNRKVKPLINRDIHKRPIKKSSQSVFTETSLKESKYISPSSSPMPFPMIYQSKAKTDDFLSRQRNVYRVSPYCSTKLYKRDIEVHLDRRFVCLKTHQSPPLPTPTIGICQEKCPLLPYQRLYFPAALGFPGVIIPPTDIRILEYIDQDPVKTIEIDGIHREIRFYGETAIIMMDWDNPREIKFLHGSRRVTFDNRSSVVLGFNAGYKQVNVDNQIFYISFGGPTRELYINGRWFECSFGGQPIVVLIDGRPRLIHLEGPSPQIDIGKVKRTDLCAGRINLIVDEMHMYPIFLDAKVQKFLVNGNFFTIRFVDALGTVLINEVPFQMEFGGLPRPIFIWNTKHYIRFSKLPRHVKPGFTHIVNMEGSVGMAMGPYYNTVNYVEADEAKHISIKTQMPDEISEGLVVPASVIPPRVTTYSASEHTSEQLFDESDKIPELETPIKLLTKGNPKPDLSLKGNIDVNNLFGKLIVTGIVKMPIEVPHQGTKEDHVVEELETEEDKITHVKDMADQANSSSFFELIESEKIESAPLEIEEESDDDDVTLNAKPVELVVLADDDADDEISDERAERDRLAEIDFLNAKVKQEQDLDDEPIITAEEAPAAPIIDITKSTVTSSIDGNLELEVTPSLPVKVPSGGIRINIHKTLQPNSENHHNDESDDVSADDEPLLPDEELAIHYKMKPSMEGVHFSTRPPIQKDSEHSAMCSIT